jgi:hypothetical protein
MIDAKALLAQVRANVNQSKALLDHSSDAIRALMNEQRQLPSAWIELQSELEQAVDSPLRLADYWLAQLEPLPASELFGVIDEVQP